MEKRPYYSVVKNYINEWFKNLTKNDEFLQEKCNKKNETRNFDSLFNYKIELKNPFKVRNKILCSSTVESYLTVARF